MSTPAPQTLVVEDDQLEAQYDAQFVPLYMAAKAVKKRFVFVKRLCLANKVTHRRSGPKHQQRILVHLPELRRFIRESEMHRPGGDSPATPPPDPRRLHPAALRMLDPTRQRRARTAG